MRNLTTELIGGEIRPMYDRVTFRDIPNILLGIAVLGAGILAVIVLAVSSFPQ